MIEQTDDREKLEEEIKELRKKIDYLLFLLSNSKNYEEFSMRAVNGVILFQKREHHDQK